MLTTIKYKNKVCWNDRFELFITEKNIFGTGSRFKALNLISEMICKSRTTQARVMDKLNIFLGF